VCSVDDLLDAFTGLLYCVLLLDDMHRLVAVAYSNFLIDSH
jgi:hypothetical protein